MDSIIKTPGLPGQLHMQLPHIDNPLATETTFYWVSSRGNRYHIASLNNRLLSDDILDELVAKVSERIKTIDSYDEELEEMSIPKFVKCMKCGKECEYWKELSCYETNDESRMYELCKEHWDEIYYATLKLQNDFIPDYKD